VTNFLYFSHSYRSEDAQCVDFFGRLLRSEGLVPSLDPPSESVNSAKLERHLASTDGMVAILTWREGGVSQHILFEIALCLRARKPLLVFVEDVLPGGVVPGRVLQRRFSRRSFLRQTREHRHALEILKMYLGEKPPPKYQPPLSQRSCLLVGADALSEQQREDLSGFIERRAYSPAAVDGDIAAEIQELIACADVAVSFVDSKSPLAYYLFGALQGACLPTITFTAQHSYAFNPRVPLEYQPRPVRTLADSAVLEEALARELELYEEDFLDLSDQDEVASYASLLLDVGSRNGHYDPGTRNVFVQELVMRDKYVTGQAGAVGPGSRASEMTFNQIWGEVAGQMDLAALSGELAELREHLRQQATGPEHDLALGEVASAELAASAGDGPRALSHLARAGKWALEVATSIGTSVDAAALKSALGV